MRIFDQKKIAVIISYANIFISNVLTLVYTPIMLKMLGDAEYGLYSLCVSIVEYLAIFNLGYASAYVKFHSEYLANHQQQKILKLNTTMFVIYASLGILILLGGGVISKNIAWLIGEKFNTSDKVTASIIVIIMTINLSFNLLGSVFSAMIATNERFIFHRILDLIKNISIPLVSMAILYVGFRSIGLAMVILVVTVITTIIQIGYCVDKFSVSFKVNYFDKDMLKTVFGYSLFLLMQSFIDFLNWQADKMILARMANAVQITYYSLGSKVNGVITNFSCAIYPVFIPKVHRLVSVNNDMERVSRLFAKVGKIQFMVVIFAFLMILQWGDDLLNIWLGEGYESAYLVAVLLCAPMVIHLSQSLGIEIVRAKNKQAVLCGIYLLVCIINVMVSIPLAEKWGAVGAAMGTCISGFITWGLIAFVFYQKVIGIKMQYWIKEVMKVLPAIVATLVIGYIMKVINLNQIVKTIISGILQLLIYLMFIFLFGLSNEEKNNLCQKVKKK